ncbi:MAG: DNA mismatch repair endonuclease MutL [Gammaproteobacteria bacterium]|nr:DNA mismatch repair endonuclease MutL [Gammaproteobacteria bacterium]
MSLTHRIQALPLHLANQIAAGEVIERPASVVKELVENSIDAGATQIYIDIEGAGSHLIRVRDNGIGIHPDDLALALSRHATSKLHSSEQLSHIASLGFRGEALPSIASVSNLSLSSRQDDSECGWQITGQTHQPTPLAHPLGTTIEVRELFFNLPARKHFLRGDKTELHHITTTLYRLALSKFDIGFHYHSGTHSIIKLPIASTTEQQQQRIAKLCGHAFIKNSHYIEQQFDEIALKGWLGTAQAHRPQTDVNYFFINGRVIRDRVINHAIRQAYADLIPAGRHPAFVLYLTLPLDKVDINVHPTKHEVRFRDARLVHGLITRALQDALVTEQKSEVIKQASLDSNMPNYNNIAEKPKQYDVEARRHKKPEQTAYLSYQIANVLHQRYIIATIEDAQPWLIDLQLAERALRQQQFRHALATNSLRSRPILVPITVTLEAVQHQAMINHQTDLATLGITFTTQHDQLIIQAIPSLLTHVDIVELIRSIASHLVQQKASLEQLSTLLEQQLPMIAVSSLQQADLILKQLPERLKSNQWCQRLDQQTLSSLF